MSLLEGLSITALGIWAYLANQPEGTPFTIASLQDAIPGRGHTAAFQELRAKKFILVTHIRDEYGKFRTVNLFVPDPYSTEQEFTEVRSDEGLVDPCPKDLYKYKEQDNGFGSEKESHVLSEPKTNLYMGEATTRSGEKKLWEYDETFMKLDEYRRASLGLKNERVTGEDYGAYQDRFDRLGGDTMHSDGLGNARAIDILAEVIDGAAHDPRGLETRRRFGTWSHLVSPQDFDACRAYYTIYVWDDTDKWEWKPNGSIPEEYRQRFGLLERLGAKGLTMEQLLTLKRRNPYFARYRAHVQKQETSERQLRDGGY